MVQILRDQRGLGNKDVGMGNQLSVNQLIAHHSVVFKPDSLLVWVSAGPWQEGKFICYDLKKVFNLEYQPDKREQGDLYDLTHNSGRHLYEFGKFQAVQGISKHVGTVGPFHEKPNSRFRRILMLTYRKTNPSLYLTYVHLGEYYEAYWYI